MPRSLLSEAEYLEEAETVTRNSLSSMRRQMLAMNSREVWQYVLKLRDPHRYVDYQCCFPVAFDTTILNISHF